MNNGIINTETKQEKIKRFHEFDNAIRNVKPIQIHKKEKAEGGKVGGNMTRI